MVFNCITKCSWLTGWIVFLVIAAEGSTIVAGGAAVEQEAESGTVGADFTVAGSAPVYITISTDGAGDNPGSTNRMATYPVTFPSAGTYELYARFYVGPSSYNDDSFFFANGFGIKSPVNNADWVTVNGLVEFGYVNGSDVVAGGGSSGTQVWKWINLTQMTGSPVFTVPSGNLVQAFQIGGRENGLRIDKLVFGKSGYPFTVDNLDNGTAPELELPIDSCIVDWSEVHQRIDGFGAGAVFLYAGLDPISDAAADQLFGTGSGQFGLSLLRIRISPTGNNWANTLDAQKAVARGARVMATPWTPPADMKSNTNLVGGYLLPGEYENYARYLDDFAGDMKANGVELAAVSIQNEPDITVSYESCDWTAEQLRVFCRDYAGLITNAPVMMPESFNFNPAVSDPTLNDPVAVGNIDIVGGHLYGTGVSDYPNARAKGKPIWMTEYLINDQTLATAIETAGQIHDCLVTGNMSAYIWWKVSGDINGLLDNVGTPQYRGYVMGQFSRFVRPNDYRIGVESAGTVKVSAFKNAMGTLSIVAVNNSIIDIDQTFTLTNCSASAQLTPWLTSSNVLLTAQTPVDVIGSSFTYTVPAMSVVTLTGHHVDTNLNRFILPLTVDNGDVVAGYGGVSGLDYILESTDDLVEGIWIPAQTNTASTDGSVVFTNALNGLQRYYRAHSKDD